MREEFTTHTLILANGDPPSKELLHQLRQDADLFLATDGAANALTEPGIVPDIVLGDFDSLLPATRERLSASHFIEAPDQNACDLEKALIYVRAQGATQITLTGAMGGRLDHMLTALSLLAAAAISVPMRIVSDRETIYCLRATPEDSAALDIPGKPDDLLSLVVFAPAFGITLTGTRWSLRDETLLPGSRTVSNLFAEKSVRLRITEGTLFAIHTPQSVCAAAP